VKLPLVVLDVSWQVRVKIQGFGEMIILIYTFYNENASHMFGAKFTSPVKLDVLLVVQYY